MTRPGSDATNGDDGSDHADGPPGGRGRARAVLLADDTEFDGADAALLRAVDRRGSVARAAGDLDRSRARALARIEELEAAFGPLVERRRGGSDGGGSRLCEDAHALLERHGRMQAAVAATASVPETALRGAVATVDGELATVETDVGAVRGRHGGVAPGESAQVRVGADDVTVHEAGAGPEPDATSARNRLSGTVADLDHGETVLTLRVDVGGTAVRALLTADSAGRLDLEAGRAVALTWKATATSVVPAPR